MAQAQDREPSGVGPAGRDDGRGLWDGVRRAVTGGDAYGTNGAERRAFWRAFAAIAALAVANCSVNVLTVLHDRAAAGQPIAAWEPTAWESTSGACILILLLIAYPPLTAALRRFRRWAPAIVVAALPLLSLLHVVGMMLARHAIYRLVGEHYPLSLADFPYEFRKDAVTYALIGTVLWAWRRIAAARPAEAEPEPELGAETAAPEARTFDIREGARTLRVPVAQIVAASSAGNYVEVFLLDGRHPLMRSTLAAVEGALGPSGFVRTHRSWLVNAAHVRAIEPEGSGDYALAMEGGPRVPVSRRYPDALARLRGPAAT